jgi:succinyl-diaminopimelate desuccinylase
MPSKLDNKIDTITDVLSHLIGFPTITADHNTNLAALDWVEAQIDQLPLEVQRFENNGFPALVATTSKTLAPKLWLVAHIDVVTASPQAFRAKTENGRLYGRGAHDMKFALAIFIVLLQELEVLLEGYDLGLMITSDEEMGGFSGVKWLIDEHNYRGGAALIPDSGGSWEMEAGAKGIMWWELAAKGRQTHASRTWDGVNAIDEMVRFVDSVRSHVPAEPCADPTHQHSTVNFSSLVSGSATNQVPGSATARLDIRFTPDTDMSTIEGWMAEAHALVPSVTAKVQLADLPYKIKNQGPVSLFQDVVQEVTGHGVTFSTAHGSSDARHFARHHIPTINVCPTGSGFHVPNEWVDVEDLGNFYEVTRRFVETWARKD